MATRNTFFNLYRHGYARVALATPPVRIGEPMANAGATLELMREAAKKNAALLESQMRKAAKEMDYIAAAQMRDELFAMRKLLEERQKASKDV